VRLEVSGGVGAARVRGVVPLSPGTRDWLVGRLNVEAPALARRVAAARPRDLVLVGRRDELPVLALLLDDQAVSVSPELGALGRVASAAVEAEAEAASAVQQRGPGSARRGRPARRRS
jgi:hypothetical protein